MKLLTTNSKLAKSRAFGYVTAGLELAPGKRAGVGELCPARGACYRTCIFSSGYGSMPTVERARLERTRAVFGGDGALNRETLAKLEREIEAHARTASKLGLRAAIRLNVFSDVDWLALLGAQWFEDRAHITFYDYTKVRARFSAFANGGYPANYDLTFSTSELCSLDDVRAELALGGRATVVARIGSAMHARIGSTIDGVQYVDGDEHDATYAQPRGCVIVLAAKGRAGSRNPEPSRFIPA